MRMKTVRAMSVCILLAYLLTAAPLHSLRAFAEEADDTAVLGGGYAASEQLDHMGYATKLYDASNGLEPSDANYVLCASTGYVWIGGYSGIFRYDGSVFTKLDTADGLTSGRGLFEDSQQRIWVGTNDNGVVVLDGNERTHFTYQDGLSSSSIRDFAEDKEGNVYIGTTSGVCYMDSDMMLHPLDDDRLNEERVLRLDADAGGRIYGYTKNGSIFRIEDRKLTGICTSEELGTEKITTIMADPMHDGNVWLGTAGDVLYYGAFGSSAENMRQISVAPLSDMHYSSYDCGRVWLTSTTAVGYLDEQNQLHTLDTLPINSGIEMSASDYQGNLWFASSRQGVMKITASSFVDVTDKAGMPAEVTNAVCLRGDDLYAGTDTGISILKPNGRALENDLTAYCGDTRIRCIENGTDGDLWVGTFTNGLGLVHETKKGVISAFTKQEGMPSDEIRCVSVGEDGTVLVGTNNGLAEIQNDRIVRTVDSADVKNAVFLDLEEGQDGELYVGTDGDGIYVITDSEIRRIGREEGLTSDVVLRIKYDEARDLYWLITSNSIEYLRDGRITCVTSFPYSNNYDLYYGEGGRIFVISSCGIFMADADEMLRDRVSNYRLYTTANGLSSAPTSNGFCALREDGTLYIPGRTGVCSVNIHSLSEQSAAVKAAVSSVYAGDTEILPDEDGNYTIPASDERIRITASVFDYTLMDPQVEVYLEGKEKDGIHTTLSGLVPLEYTGLGYGDYRLHIKVTDSTGELQLLDKTYHIYKKPRMTELPAFRISLLLIAAVLAGLIVWRVTRSSVMRRQNEELRQARDAAEKANLARSRFLSNMSHEILTPINTIVGMNELTLREDTAGVPEGYCASVRNCAYDIRNASESLLYFISDLLDMSEIESGEMHISVQEYGVRELLRDMTSMIRARCDEKGLDFTVSADEMMPCRMLGDAEKIKHIVLNLLMNSVKFTDTGSILLRVSLEERRDDLCTLRFSVKDTGIGISEADQSHLFTAGESLSASENNDELATELGLSISCRYAELMNGTLACESEQGKGTEFVFTVEQRIADPAPFGMFTEQNGHNAETYVPLFRAPDADVLLVSNDTMTVKVIKGLLKATEVFVTTVSTIEECADKMRDTRFDVIFFDLELGEADGSFPEKLRDKQMPSEVRARAVAYAEQKHADTPVYAITSHAMADEEHCRAMGYQGSIAKPIDGTALERTIMRHLPEEQMEITALSRR